ncbi:helix-turn-helix domain-containing protein, partial [Gordonia amicalis]|uniref:helix-turn-helix domain-containing protein n=1 Tax=Gordonia amicalis TaxID=89053 RepID=UPI003A806C14
MSVAAAARAVGVSKAAGRDWFSKGGGVRPATERRDLEASASVGRGRLTFTDRCRIEELMLAHYRPARIAALLGRPRSTITRELDRGRTNPGQRYRRGDRPSCGREQGTTTQGDETAAGYGVVERGVSFATAMGPPGLPRGWDHLGALLRMLCGVGSVKSGSVSLAVG